MRIGVYWLRLRSKVPKGSSGSSGGGAKVVFWLSSNRTFLESPLESPALYGGWGVGDGWVFWVNLDPWWKRIFYSGGGEGSGDGWIVQHRISWNIWLILTAFSSTRSNFAWQIVPQTLISPRYVAISRLSEADPADGLEEARNMKSMWPP